MPAARLYTRIITATGSGMIAVFARAGADGRWMQVDSVSTMHQASELAVRLEARRSLRVDTIAEWRSEDWGKDAPLVDPNDEDN